MGSLVVDLIPSVLGLMVTPAAIVGAIILLGTARPFANATAFMGGFLIVYTLVSAIVVGLAAAAEEPLLSPRTKSVVEIVVGTALLLLVAGLVVRPGDRRHARRAKKGFAARLDDATPPFAFGSGIALAIFNPNVPILVAGLASVAAADTGQVLGAILLVVAAVSGMLVPILWQWLAPAGATRQLGRIRSWIGRHDRAINVTVLLIFGTTFLLKGLVGQ